MNESIAVAIENKPFIAFHKPFSWYYVETVWESHTEDLAQFRAHLERAQTPRAAEAQAIAECRYTNPHATRVAHFMTRRLNAQKEQAIRRQIESGAWEGWRF